ncbi:cytidine deaminase [Drosophila elegans]|uniref:cytidine deaminase n=1 Tax=Drosophila elegans TaxID=30023 RepID=UPI0007E730E1|nr:cytidine deaminase [Drosophila elegans]
MAEKQKLLHRYMKNLSDMEDELRRKELEKKMKELELLQCELARRQERSGTKCAGGKINELRQKKLRKVLAAYMMTLEGLLCEVARREARLNGDRGRVSESENLPHPEMLEEYTVAFCAVGEDGRELLEAAFSARRCAYAPYSKFKVGAAFRAKCGRIYTGCNIENVSFTAGNCAERCALAKGISEGERKYTAGAVVAYHPDQFTTPCGVCRQFILEFLHRDIPIYIAKAPPPEQEHCIPAIQDTDEVLVTSAYRLMPHSFNSFE